MSILEEYGYTGASEENLGRVLAVHRERYDVITEAGETSARLKAGAYYDNPGAEYPATGDFVRLQLNPMGESLILETLPRRSRFARNDFSGHAAGYVKTVLEQMVAANFDYVFLMTSLNHDFNPRRLERYLTQAWGSGAEPVVILTKADLVEPGVLAAREYEAEQVAAGARIFSCSAVSGAGLEALKAFLQPGKTIVFLGSSGVGKSSLVNALAGWEIMAVKEIREDDSRGRHTTTHRQLLRLPSGVLIIDTPGMRELGLWEAEEGLNAAFADVEEILRRPCRFSDCHHEREPGCAVRAALESGELARERWESYLALRGESRFVSDKAAAQRDKNIWQQQIAMRSRQMKKDPFRH